MNGNVFPQKPFSFMLNGESQKNSETENKVKTVN